MHPLLKDKRVLTLIIFCLLIVIALLIVFLPKERPQAKKQELIDRYRLAENFSKEDLLVMIARMQTDPEYRFYFQSLNQHRQANVIEESVAILLAKPSSSELLKIMRGLYDQIQADSTFLYHLEFEEGFAKRPGDYPDLEKFVWDFLEMEFKLTILGTFYKFNHDPNFTFQWNKEARLAAHKLQEIVRDIKRHEFFN